MNPFEFNITVTRKEKIIRRIIYAVSGIFLSTGFLWGYFTVYKNCHDIMNAEPMTVFEINRSEDGINIVFLDKEYFIKL